MKIIYCRGGDPDAPQLCDQTQMLYGTRADYTPYAAPYMLDINWGKYNWPTYMSKVRRYRPQIVMIPDYEHPTQLSKIALMLQEIQALNLRPMICPKFPKATEDIPPSILLAISVPTKYAGFLPHPSEIEGRSLHLLGGHPDQQAYIIQNVYPNSTIESLDANVLAFKAQKGMYWDTQRGDWAQSPRHSFTTLELKIRSAKQIITYLTNSNPHINTYKKRIQLCKEQPTCHPN